MSRWQQRWRLGALVWGLPAWLAVACGSNQPTTNHGTHYGSGGSRAGRSGRTAGGRDTGKADGGALAGAGIRASRCPVSGNCGDASSGCSIAAATRHVGSATAGVFAHNSLGGSGALFGYSSNEVFYDIASVNAQTEVGASGNIDSCGLYSLPPDFRLSTGSPCIDAGTATQTRLDWEGDAS